MIKKRFIKGIISFCTAFILALLTISPDIALAEEKDNLSTSLSIYELDSKSGGECIQILEQYGLDLPEVYQNNTELAENSIKTIITDLNNGNLQNNAIPYNYTELADLAEQVMAIAETHDAVYASYTLKNSTVIGSWSDSYLNYNCYGYALDKVGYRVNPGYFSGNSFSMNMSISAMADLVVEDLDSLGYYAVKTTTKPSNLASYYNVICIRKGSNDYHLMKANTALDRWMHKPGITNPLLWNYTSPAATTWTDEYSSRNVCYAASTTYNSTIYYIKFWSKSGPGPSITSEG